MSISEEKKTVPSKQWTVEHHCFLGAVLCEGEHETKEVGMGFKRTLKEEADTWLPYAVDLRTISELKRLNDELNVTALYTERGYLCAINIPIDELWPHWILARFSAAKTSIT